MQTALSSLVEFSDDEQGAVQLSKDERHGLKQVGKPLIATDQPKKQQNLAGKTQTLSGLCFAYEASKTPPWGRWEDEGSHARPD